MRPLAGDRVARTPPDTPSTARAPGPLTAPPPVPDHGQEPVAV